MDIETDDEFVALMRARFASKPYGNRNHSVKLPGPEYWTDERYESFIEELLQTQRTIRAAADQPAPRTDDMAPDASDAAMAEWVIWFIQHRDVGAFPTHWHRVWEAIRTAILWTRGDERRRIGEALRADHAAMVGTTAAGLIDEAVSRDTVD